MQFYIGINGQQQGPFEDYELLSRGVTRDTLVWRQGMTQWTPAGQVPELSHLFPMASPINQFANQPQSAPPMQQPPIQNTPPAQPYNPGYQQQGYQQQGYQQQGYQQPGYQQPNNGIKPEVSFSDAIKICFNKFADFDGRARRSEFWWFYLFTLILSSVSCGIGGLVTLIPSLAVGSRRLHDIGKSGWLQLLMLIPIVGLILIIWWAQDSDQGDNQYGPSVKY